MRYELLGPLRIRHAEQSFSLSAPKVETTLATLLIGNGRVITKEHLVTELWGGRPPRRASAAVHVYVSQSRKFLAAAGGDPGRAIVTRPLGYELCLNGSSWDVDDFKDAMRAGRDLRSAGRHEEALARFEDALSLMRGPVLEGVTEGPVLTSFATWAEEERLQCLELSVESRTALGRHREVVGLLSTLTAQYPLRESFYRQLMLVLYRSERQAEALQVYRSAQRVLRAELGLEPHRSLRLLHQAILTSDRLLDLPTAG
ncbi:BTAD domain-containing putative transcriptional regulator [Streptomyces sp. NPDC059578]|uniref:AfsR/SARP family transcriptional regulator n=1 Tax=Streptomyces sp. NPDC059578 TaxID=3346874 RepID=UPI0036AF37C1